jgi:hypothetical protein
MSVIGILQQLRLNEQGKITGGTLMPLTNLDEREREVVRECLRAAVDGPFFPDWEFSIIFGLTRDEVRQVLCSWPDLNEADESVVRAINNSFNNLLGYPTRNKQELWPKFISVGGIELARIFDKWKGRTPRVSYKVRDHFDDAM